MRQERSDDIEMNGLNPKAVIATHGHFDHVLGASQLQEKYKIPLIIHEKDVDMMRNSGTMMNSFGIAESFTPPSKIETFTGKNYGICHEVARYYLPDFQHSSHETIVESGIWL